MNRKWIIFHLTEAQRQIEQVIEKIKDDPAYDESQFYIVIEHIYRHLNTSWNSRNVSEATIATFDDKKFDEWSDFPRDIHLHH